MMQYRELIRQLETELVHLEAERSRLEAQLAGARATLALARQGIESELVVYQKRRFAQ